MTNKAEKDLIKKDKILASLRVNPFYKHAAMAAGIDELTLLRWRKADKEFEGRCEEARSSCLTWFVKKSSSDFILTHADPETFKKDKEPETVVNNYLQLTDEQLESVIAAKISKVGSTDGAPREGETNQSEPAEIR